MWLRGLQSTSICGAAATYMYIPAAINSIARSDGSGILGGRDSRGKHTITYIWSLVSCCDAHAGLRPLYDVSLRHPHYTLYLLLSLLAISPQCRGNAIQLFRTSEDRYTALNKSTHHNPSPRDFPKSHHSLFFDFFNSCSSFAVPQISTTLFLA